MRKVVEIYVVDGVVSGTKCLVLETEDGRKYKSQREGLLGFHDSKLYDVTEEDSKAYCRDFQWNGIADFCTDCGKHKLDH